MIIVLVGPTGVGKTKMSIELAKKYHAIIVNADSMQVYEDLNIGTAKIKEEEKENIPHYLFDIVKPNEMYTVYDYQKDLRKILDNNKDKNIIIVGGTGLYVKAGLYNYEFIEEENLKVNYDNLTNEELYQKVLEKHPNSTVHINNRKRLERLMNKNNSSNKGNELLYPSIFIGLSTDRDTLYQNINNRVDKMFNEGLLDEVKNLYNNKIDGKAIRTGIGYKELYDYLDGKISLEEATDLIKKRSRHYAKRQYTWFKNQMDINWFEVDFNDFDNTINEVVNFIDKY